MEKAAKLGDVNVARAYMDDLRTEFNRLKQAIEEAWNSGDFR